MRVAIDLRALQIGHENRGIGNYLLNILKYFPKDKTEYIIIRYSSSNPVKDYSLDLGSKKHQEIVLDRHKFAKTPKGIIFFALGLFTPVFRRVKRLKPDIYFQPDFLFGLPRGRKIKKVVVVYDVIPLLFRNMYLPSWRKFARFKQLRLRSRALFTVRALYHERRYKKGLGAIKRANKVISISNTTTSDLVKIVGVSNERIETIYLAPSFVPTKNVERDNQLRKLIDKIRGNYLVFIGGTDPRRQVHELVFALNLLNSRGHDVNLVLCGNEFVKDSKELNPTTKKSIELSSYKDNIHMLGRVSGTDKKYILENALAFVYPTLYEGFGLPILESMSSNCPVITYDSPCTREVSSDSAIYTLRQDGIGIYNSVLTIINDSEKRQKLIDSGKKQSSNFSWDRTGKLTIEYILNSSSIS